MIQDLGVRVQRLGFRPEGLGEGHLERERDAPKGCSAARPTSRSPALPVWELRVGVYGVGFRVWGLGFRAQGLGFRVQSLGLPPTS